MWMRNVIYGKLISGGADPSTGRPLPDSLENIQREDLEFSPVGSTTQANIAGVATRIHNEKIAISKARYRRQDWYYSFNEAGERQLYRFVTKTPYVNNPNLIWLLVAEENMNSAASQRIAGGFEAWLKGG